MRELFLFIYRYRIFAVFLALQLVCLGLIVTQNSYQGAVFLSSSGKVAGTVYQTASDATSYLTLGEENRALAEENSRLREQLGLMADQLRKPAFLPPQDSVNTYLIARVVNNSIYRPTNYLTLNQGSAAGIQPGMGVIGPNGVVGIVKAVSTHFATVFSFLHTDVSVSALLKKDGTICSAKWDGKDYGHAKVEYVARHIQVSVGDSVLTSGFSPVFPPGTLIGVVKSVTRKDSETFLDIDIELSTDFASVSYVYVVKNRFRAEKEALEQQNTKSK